MHVEVTSAYVGPQEQLDPTYEAEEGVPQKQYFTYRIRVSNCRYASSCQGNLALWVQ